MSAGSVLVVANDPVDGPSLRQTLERLSPRTLLVVAPALSGRLAHWVSDEDRARRAASERLAACLSSLRAAGFDPDGWVGDADPLLAIEDALRVFAADEIVVATGASTRPNRLARDVVSRARRRFGRSVTEVAGVTTPARPCPPRRRSRRRVGTFRARATGTRSWPRAGRA